MNNEILLGPINWFGGYNDKKCCENNFGFFKDIKTQKDEYIHKKMFEKKDLEKLLSLSKNDIKQIYIIKNKVNSAFILNDEYLSGQSDEDKHSILKLLIKNKNFFDLNLNLLLNSKIDEMDSENKSNLFFQILKIEDNNQNWEMFLKYIPEEEKKIFFSLVEQDNELKKSYSKFKLCKKFDFENLKVVYDENFKFSEIEKIYHELLLENNIDVYDLIEIFNKSEIFAKWRIHLKTEFRVGKIENRVGQEFLKNIDKKNLFIYIEELIKNKNLIEIKNFEEHVDFFQVLSEIFLIPDYEKSRIEFLKEMYGEVILKIEKIYKKFDEKSIIEIKEILNETEKSKEIELFIFPKIFSVFKEYLKKANPNKEEILNLLFKFFDGTIIFQNEITNKQYDQIRIELIEDNFEKDMQEIENFLNVQRHLDDKKKYEQVYFCKKTGIYYNRLYWKKESCQKQTRDQEIVYSFKDGESYIGAIYYLMNLIQKMREQHGVEPYNNTIINIPASNFSTNRKRYFDFLRTLCVLTGVKNGFSNLTLNSENIIPRKKGGEGVKNSLVFNEVSTEYCLIFDDIVTEGTTIRFIESKIRQLNPKLKKIYKVAFQRTVGPYLKDGVEVEIEIYGIGGYSNRVPSTKIDTGLANLNLISGQSLGTYCETEKFKRQVVTLIPHFNRNYDHVNDYVITYSYLAGNEIIRKRLNIDPRRYPKQYIIGIDDVIF